MNFTILFYIQCRIHTLESDFGELGAEYFGILYEYSATILFSQQDLTELGQQILHHKLYLVQGFKAWLNNLLALLVR